MLAILYHKLSEMQFTNFNNYLPNKILTKLSVLYLQFEFKCIFLNEQIQYLCEQV